jgi:hypothetical protein
VQKPWVFLAGGSTALPASLHLAGNVMDGAPEISGDNWRGVQIERASGADQPLPMAPVRSEPAASAFRRVLQQVGANLSKRDAADARVIADVQNGTGKIVESQQEVGGWPEFASSTGAPVDSDNDGIPDEWELKHGLNPNDPKDAQAMAGDGYTWLERYLNELAERANKTDGTGAPSGRE